MEGIIREVLNKHITNDDYGNKILDAYPSDIDYLVNELKEVISVTRCCTELKDKKITDLLNWVKSDLKQETNVKIGKTATPYRTEKIKFLNKLLEIENL